MTFTKGHSYGKRFQKDHSPWNKDIKGIHLSPESEFKKGQAAPNKLALSSIRIRKDKNDKLRQHIKTPSGWTEYAKFIWMEKWGPLIRNDVVHHLDGNSLNDRLDNLIALPRPDHPRYHAWGLKPIPSEKLKFYMQRYFYRLRLDATEDEIDPKMYETGIVRHSQQGLFESTNTP